MSPEIQSILQELRTALEALYGARLRRLVLYGSHARGEATEESDIDVMVVLGGSVSAWKEITFMNATVTNICLQHEVLISLFPISETEYESNQSNILDSVHKEGVAV